MNKIIDMPAADIMPDSVQILRNQGVPAGAEVNGKIRGMASEAVEIFASAAEPQAIISELTVQDFKAIYPGDGKNAADAPLAAIYPQADSLAIFGLTLGKRISDKIENLFGENDFALGSMLDAAASIAADTMVGRCEQMFFDELSRENRAANGSCVLSYSPGYCGWHITAQKKLFAFLDPGQIGIVLNESCLMIPIKSVTGVLVAGEKQIHVVDGNYSFCDVCRDKTCLDRMRKLLTF